MCTSGTTRTISLNDPENLQYNQYATMRQPQGLRSYCRAGSAMSGGQLM